MRLKQGQLWKTPDCFVRIVRLERLEVEYKTMDDPVTREGALQTVTKKQFCRLIKNGELLEDLTRPEFESGPLKPNRSGQDPKRMLSNRSNKTPFKLNRKRVDTG